MKQLKAIFALTLLFTSHWAIAGPIYDGTYEISNAGSATHDRGIWTNVGSFSTVGGTFSVTGNSAVFQGDVFRSAIGGGLTFSVAMTYQCSSEVSNAGGNNVSVNNPACGLGNQPTGGAVSGSEADGNEWDFWNWAPTQLTGYGSLEGLVINVSQAPVGQTKPFRVGIAADWDDEDLLGASGWIKIESLICDPTKPCDNTTFTPGSADFNFRFTAVPEPSSLALLGLGLIGLGAARRRRQ